MSIAMADPMQFMLEAGYFSIKNPPSKKSDTAVLLQTLHKDHKGARCDFCDRARAKLSSHSKMTNVSVMRRVGIVQRGKEDTMENVSKSKNQQSLSATSSSNLENVLSSDRLLSRSHSNDSYIQSRMYGSRYRANGDERTPDLTPTMSVTGGIGQRRPRSNPTLQKLQESYLRASWVSRTKNDPGPWDNNLHLDQFLWRNPTVPRFRSEIDMPASPSESKSTRLSRRGHEKHKSDHNMSHGPSGNRDIREDRARARVTEYLKDVEKAVAANRMKKMKTPNNNTIPVDII